MSASGTKRIFVGGRGIRLGFLGAEGGSGYDDTPTGWSSDKAGDPQAVWKKTYDSEVEDVVVLSENGKQPCIRNRQGKSGFGIYYKTGVAMWGGCSGKLGVTLKKVRKDTGYAAAERGIRSMATRMKNCSPDIPHDKSIPADWVLGSPPSGATEQEIADWESYSLAVQELTLARAYARDVCTVHATPAPAAGGSTTEDTSSPGSGSYQTYEEVDLYGNPVVDVDAYTPAGATSVPQGGGTIVPNPFAPPPPEPEPEMGTPTKVAIGVGGAAVLGVLALVILRKKKKRSRSR